MSTVRNATLKGLPPALDFLRVVDLATDPLRTI